MTLIFLFSLTTRMKVKLNESRKLMRIRSQEKARLLHVAMFSIVTCCYRTTTNVFSWVHWWPSLLMLFFVVFAVQMFMLALQSCTTLLTLICYCFISKVRSSRRSVVKATDLHWAKLGSTPAGSHWWLRTCTGQTWVQLPLGVIGGGNCCCAPLKVLLVLVDMSEPLNNGVTDV